MWNNIYLKRKQKKQSYYSYLCKQSNIWFCIKGIKNKSNLKFLYLFQISGIAQKKKKTSCLQNLSWTITLNERSFQWMLEARNQLSNVIFVCNKNN